jgi:hypothetical protein
MCDFSRWKYIYGFATLRWLIILNFWAYIRGKLLSTSRLYKQYYPVFHTLCRLENSIRLCFLLSSVRSLLVNSWVHHHYTHTLYDTCCTAPRVSLPLYRWMSQMLTANSAIKCIWTGTHKAVCEETILRHSGAGCIQCGRLQTIFARICLLYLQRLLKRVTHFFDIEVEMVGTVTIQNMVAVALLETFFSSFICYVAVFKSCIEVILLC